MTQKTYSIFGAGAAGLYTAWRLLQGKSSDPEFAAKQLAKGDVLELYDWGKYNFNKRHPGTRAAGARVCTWHYKNDKGNSFVELGGMRYSHWDERPSKAFPDPNDGVAPGHRVVSKTISLLGLDKSSVPFNVTNNQLFYLRTRNFYLDDISSSQPAPYAVDHYGASTSPDQGFTIVENLVEAPQTRKDWCTFYNHGRITAELPSSSVFQKGDLLKDIGYWNLLYDQLGSEGYAYAADGNGYSSNVINTSSAVSFNINNEFAPGSQYRTLSMGYSGMFNALFDKVVALAKRKGVEFRYHPDTRLHSILWKGGKALFTVASRANPNIAEGKREADAAWLAMPRAAIDLVAQATRFARPGKGVVDVLNHEKVNLYLESTIMQPSYKIGMFFDQPWWSPDADTPPRYPALIIGYVITASVIADLHKQKFPAKACKAMVALIDVPYSSAADLVAAIETSTEQALTITQVKQLTAAARRDTIGPSVSNSPIRMVVYFGNNAPDQTCTPIYGILASYDDEDNTTFWQELELGSSRERTVPISADTQPLEGPRKVPARMTKMLRKMLAELHYGPNSDYSSIPEPLEAAYMDWSLPPFNAGYHEWAPHFNIGDVQRKICKPSQLVEGADAEIYIVGEAYSNDQAWVEGAYCTSEYVLNQYFGIDPIIDNENYPFICPA
jgi:predicted dinucleotide-binding enzyme